MADDKNAINTVGMSAEDLALVQALQSGMPQANQSTPKVESSPSTPMELDDAQPDEEIIDIEDLKLALHGHKRGRKIGSGLGEKRKAAEEYSQNPNTVKARRRYDAMGPLQRKLHAVKTADNSAISRQTKKLKTSAHFQNMTKEDQENALAAVKEDMLDRRFRLGYNADMVKTAMQAMLEDHELQDEDFVRRQVWKGNTDVNAEEYWVEDDDGFTNEEAVEKKTEEFIGEELDLLSEFMDVVHDNIEIGKDKRTLTAAEMNLALDQMQSRQKAKLAIRGDNFAFFLWKKEFRDRIKKMKEEILLVEDLDTETAKVMQPHEYFSKNTRGLLRCVWSFYDQNKLGPDWIELPGPAELWPDDQAYYVKHGFEVYPYFAARHRQALELVGQKEAPEDWAIEVLHEEDRYELIWFRNFTPLNKI